MKNYIKEENCLATFNPEIAKQWHPTKNENLTPFDVAGKSGKKVWWLGECGHEWEAKIDNRSRLGRGCPYCHGTYVGSDNCLATINPLIAKEWNYNKNKLTPYEVTANSGRKVWWKCKYGHEWVQKIATRNKLGSECPYCSGRKVCLENCLATLRPDITKEWHPTLNNDLTPYDITSRNKEKVWWKCDNGHSFHASISKRTNRGDGCPYCYGRYPTDENNLEVTHPEFASQWHPTKNGNLTPRDVLASSSSQKVWWLCDDCGHEWETTPNGRKYGEVGCPKCGLHRSKGEEKIEEILNLNNIKNIKQYTFGDCKNIHPLPFDHAILDDSLNLLGLIEFDGKQHFEPIEYWGGIEKFKKRQMRDQIKNDYCKKNNISLLRIPYWEEENIDKLVSKFLSEIINQ